MMNRIFPAALAVAALIVLSATQLIATTWKILNADALVREGSDVIVAGEITSVEKAAVSAKRIGIIDVSERIYSTGKPGKIRIEMDANDYGNDFKVGDRGVWFLRRVVKSDAQPMTLESTKFPPPILGTDFDSQIFQADHPSMFWREPVKEDASRAKEMECVRRLVRGRRDSDERFLWEALKVTQEELKAPTDVPAEKK